MSLDIETLPQTNLLAKALKGSDLNSYATDPKYKKWVDDILKRANEINQNPDGAARLFTGSFQFNRPNQAFYALKTYPYRFSGRYAYDRPSQIFRHVCARFLISG